MSLETGTYISDLNSSNPTGSDPKSAGDDHLRLVKSTIKATFPNISGAVTPTHTELNYVDGVTSAIQTQLDTKAPKSAPTFTGTATFSGALNANGTNTLASTTSIGDVSATELSYVNGVTSAIQTQLDAKAKIASPALTGVPTAPTAATGTGTTQIATCEFVAATSLESTLPGQTGNAGKYLTTDGSSASWNSRYAYVVKTSNYTATSGNQLLCNTSSASFTVTLPSSPTANDFVEIKDYTGDFFTNNLTIARNGENIEGEAEDLVADVDNVSFTLVYVDSTKGWVLI